MLEILNACSVDRADMNIKAFFADPRVQASIIRKRHTTGAPDRAASAVSCKVRSSNLCISVSSASRRGGGPGSVGIARTMPFMHARLIAVRHSRATCCAAFRVASSTCDQGHLSHASRDAHAASLTMCASATNLLLSQQNLNTSHHTLRAQL